MTSEQITEQCHCTRCRLHALEHAEIHAFAAIQAEAIEAANPYSVHDHRHTPAGAADALSPTGASATSSQVSA